MLAELSRREKAANVKPDPDIDVYMKAAAMEGQEASVVTDYIIKILGLEICADTMVGDQMLRGISGGQKKRLTTDTVIYLLHISMTIAKLPVFYKQRDFLFYPSWAYALPSWIVKIPVAIVESTLWTVITYYVLGFDPNITRFFKQLLLLLLINQMSSAMFRFIGAIGRNMIVASTFGAFALLICFVLGGFVLSRDNVNSVWIWGYWASPMMYAMNGIAVNEFLGHQWRTPLNGTTLGKTAITARGFFPYAYWYWIAIGATVGFTIIFNITFALSLEFLNPFEKVQASVPAKEDDDLGAVELSTRPESEDESNRNTKKGMILPFEPHSITFDDVTYSVDMPPDKIYKAKDANALPHPHHKK
ncbi:hypothetical protein L2E82_02497 [Cichorium intybus]|uniref:Uncharacterized protein n=1 Tax=Cichorium intybus TaxID=13427 RepID=A0ACB9H1Y9_CICIN|nr:hypothetical protein L2E82_02497 [Cichorium intybus]